MGRRQLLAVESPAVTRERAQSATRQWQQVVRGSTALFLQATGSRSGLVSRRVLAVAVAVAMAVAMAVAVATVWGRETEDAPNRMVRMEATG